VRPSRSSASFLVVLHPFLYQHLHSGPVMNHHRFVATAFNDPDTAQVRSWLNAFLALPVSAEPFARRVLELDGYALVQAVVQHDPRSDGLIADLVYLLLGLAVPAPREPERDHGQCGADNAYRGAY
jgi:hypothetical protein